MRENVYQAKLIKKLYRRYRGCVVIKNDPGYQQGILDLTILFEDKWAMLEVKAYQGAPEQPNQGYFVELFNSMSFAALIYPENEEEVLRELDAAFATTRERARRP